MSQGFTRKNAQYMGGRVVQVVNYQTGDLITGTNTIPMDDTIPQITEGDEYMTLAITPTNANNKLLIEVLFFGGGGTTSHTVALFQDSGANAIAAVGDNAYTNYDMSTVLRHFMTAGTTSSTTFKVRAGMEAAVGTLRMNGSTLSPAGRRYGGVAASSITITEIAA